MNNYNANNAPMNTGMQDPNQICQQPNFGNNPNLPRFDAPMSPPDLVSEGFRQAIVAYEASRDIRGVVRLRLPPGKKAEHLGIKVQFIGRIDMVMNNS